MAKKVQVTLVDDLDGSEAGSTVSFGFQGKNYELDLSTENADKLAELLAPYISVARKIGRSGRALSAPKFNNTNAIREWANQNGYNVAGRGRVPAEVQAAYEKANS